MPMSPHWKHWSLILTTEYIRATQLDFRGRKSHVLESLTYIATFTWVSFYQAEDICNPVWLNTEPLLKLRPCREEFTDLALKVFFNTSQRVKRGPPQLQTKPATCRFSGCTAGSPTIRWLLVRKTKWKLLDWIRRTFRKHYIFQNNNTSTRYLEQCRIMVWCFLEKLYSVWIKLLKKLSKKLEKQ